MSLVASVIVGACQMPEHPGYFERHEDDAGRACECACHWPTCVVCAVRLSRLDVEAGMRRHEDCPPTTEERLADLYAYFEGRLDDPCSTAAERRAARTLIDVVASRIGHPCVVCGQPKKTIFGKSLPCACMDTLSRADRRIDGGAPPVVRLGARDVHAIRERLGG